jgi:hypothetical protein
VAEGAVKKKKLPVASCQLPVLAGRRLARVLHVAHLQLATDNWQLTTFERRSVDNG